MKSFYFFCCILLFCAGILICFSLYYTNMHVIAKFALSSFCLVSLIVIFLAPNPKMKSVAIPENAETVTVPDRGIYLSVWKEGSRVNMVFANMPWAKVSFDAKAAGKLSKILGSI